MTPDLYACVANARAAERAGDAAEALEWHRSVPMFARGRHTQILGGLSALGPDLPAWVWARWIAYLATRREDGTAGALANDRLRRLVEGFHDDLLEACYRAGGDPIKVAARVAGESWLYQQLVVHEDQGLRSFVAECVSGPLADNAALALQWAGARMSGYEIGSSRPGMRLHVREVGREEWQEVLDLGARCCTRTGFALGRLVPSGLGDRLMFDTAPLGVPAELAQSVAASAAPGASAAWWTAVEEWRRSTGAGSSRFLREDYELTSDVLELEMLRFGTDRRDLRRVTEQLRTGRDEIGRAAFRVLDRAYRGDVAPADQAYVGAAALNVRAFDDIRRRRPQPDDAIRWRHWADRVAAPARDRLLALAGRSEL